MSIFFDRLEALCRERGETPNAMARRLGIPSGSITAWKRGSLPRAETLKNLTADFDVSADYLLGKDSAEKTPIPENERSKDPDIRRIERAKARMPESEWKRQMNVIAASFGDYFSDEFEDDDVDE